MNKAVFLDRDGVVNELIFRDSSGEYEPPHKIDELVLYPDVLESIEFLLDDKFYLFLVSNQPDYAKGKCSLNALFSVQKKLDSIFKKNDINFKEYFYCYHHPNGVVPEYSRECECRKPKPYFLLKAKDDYDIEMKESWMIGDRDTDIFCGQSGGVKTVLVNNKLSNNYHGKSVPNHICSSLKESVDLILKITE